MYILQRSLPLVASPVYSHTHTQPFIRFYSRLSRSAFISPLSVGVIRRQNGAFIYQGDYNATPGLLHSRLMSTETKNSPASPNNEGKTPTTVIDTAKQVSTTEVPQPPAKQQDKEGVSAFVKKWDVKIRKVANHYWLGTKLLSKNVAITTKLLRAVMNGHAMTRRERRLLVQTSADILRMIPFVIIVVVPFMEFALPVLLKLFPNMLPSTYEWKSEKEEHRAKRLKVNLEMAKFLNETMTEVSVDMKKANALDAQAFTDVMEKVKHDQKVTNKDILKVAQLFQDEFTLDKISREQLLAMNNYLGGSSLPGKWMSTDFIRTRLLNKIDKIKQDDKLIRREGLDALSMEELVDASLVRGMKVEGLNRKRIQQQLNEWLELSQNQNVPASLLILSRAFMITQTIRPEEALEDTLAHIPAEAVEEVKRDLPRAEEERARERLAELDKEKELIEKAVKEEQQEKKKLEKEKKEKKEEKKPVAPAEKPHIPVVGQENLIDLEETKRVLAAAAEVADEQEKEIIQDIEQDIEEIKKKQEIIEDVLEELPKETLEGDKRPKVLAEKLKDIIEDIEEEIEKMEKEHEEDKGKAEKADKEKKETKTETK